MFQSNEKEAVTIFVNDSFVKQSVENSLGYREGTVILMTETISGAVSSRENSWNMESFDQQQTVLWNRFPLYSNLFNEKMVSSTGVSSVQYVAIERVHSSCTCRENEQF